MTILLAHGAGASMDSPSMTAIAKALANEGLQVARFEFAYMAARRTGARRPPPRAETLVSEYRAAVDALHVPGRLVIGGRSMGGRVASLVADVLYSAGTISGLVCLGYPFHPLGKPDQLRTSHLAALATPTLICQGTRDGFGSPDEVASYDLSPQIELLWIEDGDHGLKPRKSVTGLTEAQSLKAVATAIKGWLGKIMD